MVPEKVLEKDVPVKLKKHGTLSHERLRLSKHMTLSHEKLRLSKQVGPDYLEQEVHGSE